MNQKHTLNRPPPRSSVLAVFLLVLSILSITAGASLAKRLFEVAGASGTTVVRIGIGALLLCLFWRPWRFTIDRPRWRAIAPYGVCLGAMNFLFYLAIARLPIGLAIAIEFLGPLSVALLYSRKSVDFLWAITAALGILLILPVQASATAVNWPGVGFALAAAFAWACYIVLGKRASAVAPAGLVTSVGMVIGFLVLLPFGLGPAVELLSHREWLAIALAVGLLSSAVPYSLEMIALKRLPEKHFGLLMSLEPAIGALMAYLILAEKLTATQGVAIALIVVASVGSSYSNSADVVPSDVPTDKPTAPSA